jgi:hypothetical protein
MFTNQTIGKFFVLMGSVNTHIRSNTTYSGNEGLSVACSQKNEYVSDLFHNLSYIGEPLQSGDANSVYDHIHHHIKWFDELTFAQLSIYKDIGINLDEVKSLFEEMRWEVEALVSINIPIVKETSELNIENLLLSESKPIQV